MRHRLPLLFHNRDAHLQISSFVASIQVQSHISVDADVVCLCTTHVLFERDAAKLRHVRIRSQTEDAVTVSTSDGEDTVNANLSSTCSIDDAHASDISS